MLCARRGGRSAYLGNLLVAGRFDFVVGEFVGSFGWSLKLGYLLVSTLCWRGWVVGTDVFLCFFFLSLRVALSSNAFRATSEDLGHRRWPVCNRKVVFPGMFV